jgi:hypothetical protein
MLCQNLHSWGWHLNMLSTHWTTELLSYTPSPIILLGNLIGVHRVEGETNKFWEETCSGQVREYMAETRK